MKHFGGQIRFLHVYYETQLVKKFQNKVVVLNGLKFGMGQNHSAIQVANNSDTSLMAIPGNCTCDNSKQSQSRAEPKWHSFELEKISLEFEPQESAATGSNINMGIGIK